MADRKHPKPSRAADRNGRGSVDETDVAASPEHQGADTSLEDPEADTSAEDMGAGESAEDDDLERLSAGGELDEDSREELGVDNVVGPAEAGIGGGLDEEEEARAGITDEEIAGKTKRR